MTALVLLSTVFGMGTASASCGPVPAALHRGSSEYLHSYTENTYLADVSSWQAGADYVENDLRWTRDNRPMLMHDPTVDRTTNGTGYLRDMTARQVRTLRTDDGQRVPFLGTILRAAKVRKTGLVIEVKTRLTDRQARKLVRLVRDTGMVRRVVATVWNDHNARAIESRAPRILTARYDPTRRWRRTIGAADMYVLGQSSLTIENVRILHRSGVLVFAPTVWVPGASTLQEAYRAINYIGIDMFLTSETRWYTSWREQGCP